MLHIRNSPYMAILPVSIQKDEVVKQGDTKAGVTQSSRSSVFKIADLFSKIDRRYVSEKNPQSATADFLSLSKNHMPRIENAFSSLPLEGKVPSAHTGRMRWKCCVSAGSSKDATVGAAIGRPPFLNGFPFWDVQCTPLRPQMNGKRWPCCGRAIFFRSFSFIPASSNPA